MRTRLATSLFATLLLVANVVRAEDGVTADEIILGQSCALSGDAQALGTGMRDGLEACFSRINAAGGIQGRTVRLITRDDGYEPEKAIVNVRELIEQEKVFALIGEVGTPTSTAVVPIAEAASIPFFGPFTGAEFLRNPYRRYVINVRGSYYQEMEKLAEYLVDQKGLKKIACFYQNDGYGQTGLEGLEIALRRRSLEVAGKGTYERNTTAVKSGLLAVRKTDPEAVVMVGAYKACAEFIKLARKVGMNDTIYCNISFVGTDALCEELGDAGDGCIISQVVRFPWDDSVELVKEYQGAMKDFKADIPIGFVSLEGYMVGKLFCMALSQVEGEITREKFIDSIKNTGTFDLGGVTLHFGPEDHQGMDEVYMTIIQNSAVESMSAP